MSIPLNHRNTAFVLVGGLGTRLRKVLGDLPKPLAPIAGEPFLDLLLRKLSAEGIESVFLLAGFESHRFDRYKMGYNNLKIEVIVEPSALGSAGALALARDSLRTRGQLVSSYLLINGDTWLEGSLKPLLTAEVDAKIPVALAVVYQEKADRYGIVELSDQLEVKGFREKEANSKGWINAGYMLIHSNLVDRLEAGRFSSMEKDVFPGMTSIRACKIEGQFVDIGIPEDYAKLLVDRSFIKIRSQMEWAIPLFASWLQHGVIVTNQKSIFDRLKNFGFDNVSLVMELNLCQGLSERDLCIIENSEGSEQLLIALNRNSACGLLFIETQLPKSNSMLEVKPNSPRELFDASVSKEFFESADLSEPLQWIGEMRWHYNYRPIPRQPCLFLDRDGTIIEHVHYISDPKDVKLIPNIVQAMKVAQDNGWALACITNQSGIGRGHYSWSDYVRVQSRMIELLAMQGVFLTDCAEAPYYWEAETAKFNLNSSMRKPRTGMITSLAQRWGFDLEKSIMVGDSLVDLQAGTFAGVAHVVCVGNKSDEFIKYQAWLQKWPNSRSKIHQDPKAEFLRSLVS